MKRFLWLGLVVLVYIICTGCGETYRPIIIPNPPVFPNPKASHTVLSLNDNGTVVQGTAMVVDVSGDTDQSIANVGIAPVHAVQQTSSQVLVANHSAANPGADSLTRINFNNVVISSTTTIGLPTNSAPNFVASAPNQNTAYVSLSNLNTIGVINTLGSSLANTFPVGSNPDAIAVTPDNTKVYVANQGDSSVSGFNVLSNFSLSSRTVSGSFNAPLWLIERSDNQRLYVLNGNGVVTTIDTTSTAGPDTAIDDSINVPGAYYMLYDGNLNRLYIPWGGQLTMLDISQSVPVILTGAPIPIAPVSPSVRTQGDVCSAFSPPAVTSMAVTALPDGSRAYVGSYAEFGVNLSISGAAVDPDGVHTTYTYSLLPPGNALLPGMVVTISGVISKITNPSAFNGTFTVLSVGGGTFEVANGPNPADTYKTGGTGGASNICPQVTVINTVSNTIKNAIAIPGFPAYDSFCSAARFRFTMASGGDSSRAYLASCDGGMVNIIDTSTDTYFLNLTAPISTRSPIPPDPLNPPQNPVFLIAGP
jgi:DNA-binding beta-propeller fold protein YncE